MVIHMFNTGELDRYSSLFVVIVILAENRGNRSLPKQYLFQRCGKISTKFTGHQSRSCTKFNCWKRTMKQVVNMIRSEQ